MQDAPSASRRSRDRPWRMPACAASATPRSTRPNTYFNEFTRAQAEQRALPRHRLQPEQPGDHDVHRRRPAAERELVEHRAARRRADRIRARTAERALRPQHAGRPGEHHQRPAVAEELDGRAERAVRQFQRRRPAGHRVRSAWRAGVARRRRRLLGARRLHDQHGDRPRSGLALGGVQQDAAAVDAGHRLGRARHRDDRARTRWRLRVERPGVAARRAVPRGARLRRLHPPRSRRADHSREPRRQDASISRPRPASCGGRPTI